jgi:hypothetical protein
MPLAVISIERSGCLEVSKKLLKNFNDIYSTDRGLVRRLLVENLLAERHLVDRALKQAGQPTD